MRPRPAMKPGGAPNFRESHSRASSGISAHRLGPASMRSSGASTMSRRPPQEALDTAETAESSASDAQLSADEVRATADEALCQAEEACSELSLNTDSFGC